MKKLLLFLCLILIACAPVEPAQLLNTRIPTSTPQLTKTVLSDISTKEIATAESITTKENSTRQAEIIALQHQSTVTKIAIELNEEIERSHYAPYFRSLWLAGLFLFILFSLVWLLIQSIAQHNKNKPIVFNNPDGSSIEIPSEKIKELPASFLRSMKKQAIRQEIVTLTDNEVRTIDLPPITEGHVLVVGPTDAGKTTTMRAIIKDRQNVVVIDPHNNNEDWGNLRVIGGGLNFEEIKDYIQFMDSEITKRFTQRLNGKKDFESLTIVVDELPAIIMEIGKQFGAIWAKWIMQGRKVKLFVIMGSQSSRVAVLGIEGKGDILENFNYVITLGKKAQAVYKELVENMERPAIIHSVDGVFPVVIPNIKTVKRINQEYSSVDNVSQTDTIKILTMYDNQKGKKNLAEIQQEIFGKTGGAYYYKIRDILVENGKLEG